MLIASSKREQILNIVFNTSYDARMNAVESFTPLDKLKGSYLSRIARLNATNLRYLLYTNTKLVYINTIIKRLTTQAVYEDKSKDLAALSSLKCKEILKQFDKKNKRYFLKNTVKAMLLQNTLNIFASINSCELLLFKLKKEKKEDLKRQKSLASRIEKDREKLNLYFIKKYSKHNLNL